MRQAMIPFFGIAARRAILDYVLATVLLMFVLLSIAWAIDLAREFGSIRRNAAEREVSLISILAPYLGYRAVDILTRLLPVACFFGVFIAEILRRFRLDTVILSAAGSSPLRLLGPVLVFGGGLGLIMVLLHATWRPAAIEAQVRLKQGAYYHRFKDRWMPGERWFVYGDTALRGELYRAAAPRMRNVLVFRGLQDDRLGQTLAAKALTPTDVPGRYALRGVMVWDSHTPDDPGQPLPDQEIALPTKIEELRYNKIEGNYLRRTPLLELANSYPGTEAQVFAAMALWSRALIWLLPFALAALAVSFARMGFSGRVANIPRLIALGTAGYVAVTSVKVLYAIGEISGLTPFLANFLPIVTILTLALVLTWRSS